MILLTGSTGFLGSALLRELLARGEEVVALKRSTSTDWRVKDLLQNPKLHFVCSDLVDPSSIFEEYSITIIIHAATEYGRGSTPIYDVLDANLVVPIRLAELGAKFRTKCFINIDSFFNKYGNSYSNLLHYSLSKKSLLIWLEKLSANLKIVNIVLEHMYGPCDGPSKFVESMVQRIAIAREERVPLTHGHQRRDFIFIDDVVNAILLLLNYARSHSFVFEQFELGTGTATEVREIAEMVKNISLSPTILGFGDIPYRNDEIMYSCADNSKLIQLGWSPAYKIKDGLLSIISKAHKATHIKYI